MATMAAEKKDIAVLYSKLMRKIYISGISYYDVCVYTSIKIWLFMKFWNSICTSFLIIIINKK